MSEMPMSETPMSETPINPSELRAQATGLRQRGQDLLRPPPREPIPRSLVPLAAQGYVARAGRRSVLLWSSATLLHNARGDV